MAKILSKPMNGRTAPGDYPIGFENQDAIQNYIRSQIYFRGFSINVNAGSNANVGNIQLGGSARFMYGLLLFIRQAEKTQDDTFSLIINNEVIFDGVLWKAFNPEYNGMSHEQFYPVPRPLSGNDTVAFSWTAANATVVYPVFYLSNFAPKAAK